MRVRVLGSVGLIDADGRVLPRPERKAREILTALVWLAPAAVSLGELTDLLWDAPPSSATRTIRSHLSRLRTLLAQADLSLVRVGSAGYRLDLPPAASDVDTVKGLRHRASQLAADGRPDSAAQLLGAARRLWAGDLELPATTGALPLARAARRQHRQLVHEHLRCIVDGTDPGVAVAELEGLTTADPTDEPTWALYVRALQRDGHHAEAVGALARARAALDEIGLTIGRELRQLETDVFTDAVAPATAPASVPDGGRTDDPAVLYTDRGDHHVAYAVMSAGPRDLVVLNPAMITIDGLLDEPRARRALARLGEGARVICLDRSGVGLSDPLRPDADPLARWADDVVDVLDALDIRAAPVLAGFDAGLIAVSLAARHPDRVSRLVLAHCYATYARRDGYPYGPDPAAAEQLIHDTVSPRPADERIETAFLVAPSAAVDDTFRRWWTRIGQRGAGPGTALTLRRIATTSDVRPRLTEVVAPTLVVHRRSCLNVDIGHARYLAEHLAFAELAVVPGTDSLWFTDTPDLLDRAVAFLGSVDSDG